MGRRPRDIPSSWVRMTEVLEERIAAIRADLARIEASLQALTETWDRTAVRQGERIGLLEQGMTERRADFRWAMRLGVAIFSLVQAAALLILSNWLSQAQENQLADIRSEAVGEVRDLRAALRRMGLDLEGGAFRPPKDDGNRVGG